MKVTPATAWRRPYTPRMDAAAQSMLRIGAWCADPLRGTLTQGSEVVRVDAGSAGRLDLGVVLDVLSGRKILSVMLECGSELNGAFLTQGQVDKVVLFYAETKLGDGAIPFARGFGPPVLLEQEMKGIARKLFGEDVRVSGVLRDAWEGIG